MKDLIKGQEGLGLAALTAILCLMAMLLFGCNVNEYDESVEAEIAKHEEYRRQEAITRSIVVSAKSTKDHNVYPVRMDSTLNVYKAGDTMLVDIRSMTPTSPKAVGGHPYFVQFVVLR